MLRQLERIEQTTDRRRLFDESSFFHFVLHVASEGVSDTLRFLTRTRYPLFQQLLQRFSIDVRDIIRDEPVFQRFVHRRRPDVPFIDRRDEDRKSVVEGYMAI